MARSLLRLLTLAVAGSALAPLVTVFASRCVQDQVFPWHLLPAALLAAVGITAVTGVLYFRLKRREGSIDRAAADQATFLGKEISEDWVAPAIVVSAALSLFLELAIIRWQATVFPFFAFYKNLSLLSCFAGLGLGYSLARQNRVPLFVTLPLFCWQFLFMMGMRYGLAPVQFHSLYLLPFREQLNMGLPRVAHLYQGLQTYYVLAVVFLLTAVAFVPVGQLCGCLLERRKKLVGYGLNLLGSLAGVLLMFLVSAFWTPPAIWFLIAFAALLFFHARQRSILLIGTGSAVLSLVVLAWPVSPAQQRIYSPYQLLEVGHGEHGWMEVQAAGHIYQRVYDFSNDAAALPANSPLARARDYYNLPYEIVKRPEDVVVVGSGTGNDVVAALRGGAEHVDAVEIDPAILLLGREGHPDHPYSDYRVRAVVDDARSFLRTTHRHYDLIVFGLLDSHTLLSHASSVRLESFVYTVQAMREARARLKPHGVISLTFYVMNDELGRKIYLMLQDAFDGHPPLCVQGQDAGVLFLESEDHQLSLPPGFLAQRGFSDKTAAYANPGLRVDVSTDDWPFFYMPQRVYPLSYLIVVFLVLLLSLVLVSSLLPLRAQSQHLPFFLLGAGFMLVETKSITELGLTFGNSWQVIGFVIAGIMVMAFLANAAVQKLAFTRPVPAYLLLFASLALGWWVAGSGGLPSTWTGRLGTVVLLTSPLFFSGIVFSTLLSGRGEISGALSANLFGAMCGGLLEYNSMYFGFQFLYLMAAGLYFFAFVWELWTRKSGRLAITPAGVRAQVS